MAIWSNAEGERRSLASGPPLLYPPFSPHLLQPIIAALVRVQLAGGSHSVAIVIEVGVGVLQLRHLGDLI